MSNVTFVYLSKCNIKLPGFFWKFQKKVFLNRSNVHICHLYTCTLPPPTYFPRLGAGLEAERALWSRAPRPSRCNQLQSPGKNKMIILNLSALKEFILCEREKNPELTKVQPFYWIGDRLCDIYIAGTCLALAQLLQTPCEATTG